MRVPRRFGALTVDTPAASAPASSAAEAVAIPDASDPPRLPTARCGPPAGLHELELPRASFGPEFSCIAEVSHPAVGPRQPTVEGPVASPFEALRDSSVACESSVELRLSCAEMSRSASMTPRRPSLETPRLSSISRVSSGRSSVWDQHGSSSGNALDKCPSINEERMRSGRSNSGDNNERTRSRRSTDERSPARGTLRGANPRALGPHSPACYAALVRRPPKWPTPLLHPSG